MNHGHIAMLICILMSVGAGCVFVDPAPSTQQRVKVEFTGDMEVNDTRFSLNGVIRTSGHDRDESAGTIENVTVTLYEADGNPLCTHRVGSVPLNGSRKPISMRWPALPKYIIIDANDIWESNVGAVTYYTVSDDGNVGIGGTVKSRSGFPVDTTNKSETPCNE